MCSKDEAGSRLLHQIEQIRLFVIISTTVVAVRTGDDGGGK